MKQIIPEHITKFFWGDDLTDLSLENNKKYIVQTLLEKGDIDDVKWLFSKVEKDEVKILLPSLKLSKLSANYWNIFFNRK